MNPTILESLHLKPNEEAVLQALIRMKYPKNVTTISREAQVPRTTTEYILRKFERRRLSKKITSIDLRTRGESKRMYWMFNKRSVYLR